MQNLQPETSRAVNLGATWQSRTGIELSVDYFDYAFEDVLRKDNAQAIVNADPFDARVERTSAGTISIVNVAFINADAIDVRGVDVAARARFDSSLGALRASFDGTVLLAYDVTNAGVVSEGLSRLKSRERRGADPGFQGRGRRWPCSGTRRRQHPSPSHRRLRGRPGADDRCVHHD